MSRTDLIIVGVLVGLVLTLAAGVHAQEHVWGTSSASLSSDPGFVGYWKYCLTITWDVTNYGGKPHALSHISILLGLENCPRACDFGYFAFADTVGYGTGEKGCTAHYYSYFECKGDPTIPVRMPTVKFEPYESGCEPGVAGTAVVCFYSVSPPRPIYPFLRPIWIKFGLNVTDGPLEGVLPNCINPSNALEPSTWGAIKALFD